MFDKSLLDKSIDERIQYFEDFKIAHPLLTKAYKELENKIAVAEVNDIMLFFGPTGVGKTTIYNKLVENIYKKNEQNMDLDKGLIPVLPVEAIASEGANFDWKDFYFRALMALNEPLLSHKVDVMEDLSSGRIIIKQSESVRSLRISLENAIKYRKPSVILIDEGQHLMKIKSGRRFFDQMDVLKSPITSFNN